MTDIREVNYFEYSTDDIIGRCPACGGDMVDAPEFINHIEVTEEQRKDFEMGLWTVLYCPLCYRVDVHVQS